MVVLNGTRDVVTPPAWGEALAEHTGGRLITLEGSGHVPQARIPAKVNLMLREFITGRPWRDRTVHRPNGRPRALYVSSPIGLGHARRDLAIAHELRTLAPALEVEWLAQDPVTRLLDGRGEPIHPASAVPRQRVRAHRVASRRARPALLRGAAPDGRDPGRELHGLPRAWCEEERFDLVVGDEAWDIDHFLHENPELKRAPFAWMTDFVGFLPMPDGGDARGAPDRRLQRGDDRARRPLPVHSRPGDLRRQPRRRGARPLRTGPSGDPRLDRASTSTSRATSPASTRRSADRSPSCARELGYRDDEQVCVVTVGGSGVGARPAAAGDRRLLGPRSACPACAWSSWPARASTRASLPAPRPRVHAYVPDLYRHLAACDLAVVQGGLTTTMELTASRRPFVYLPLRHHFEQNFHVRHRLDRYEAGRRMDYAPPPDVIAEAIAAEIGRDVPIARRDRRRAPGRRPARRDALAAGH